MSLDGYVYCDCLERGRLLLPVPAGIEMEVLGNGMRCCKEEPHHPDDLAGDAYIRWWEDYCQWNNTACLHPEGILVHHRLGNMGTISVIRGELSRQAERFPILLSKVVYDGMHGGDHLPTSDFPALEQELDQLRRFRCDGAGMPSRWRWLERLWSDGDEGTPAAQADWILGHFRLQMFELLILASRVGKPIAF